MKNSQVVNYTAQFYANAETAGKVGETTLFVPYMIVGESAEVRLNYQKGNVAYGDAVKLLHPSKLRVKPMCSHFGVCGGCALMHMDYAEQLRFKQHKVVQNFKKIAGLEIDVLPCKGSSQVLRYRNKLSLPVRGTKGNVQIGMFCKNSHKIVDLQRCFLCGEWSDTLIALFRSYLNQQGIEPYNENDFSGQVRHIVARFVENQLLVTVVCNGTPTFNLAPFAQSLGEHFQQFGLFVNINTLHNNVILGDKTLHVAGIKHIRGEHLNVKFQLQPTSFFQVNDSVKDGIYLLVKQLLDVGKTQVLVECFSGVGILTNVLASPNYQTYAVEIDPVAVADADKIAKVNGNFNITNICGDVTKQLGQICKTNADKRLSLVVDPPRKGLGQDVCNTILQAGFDNIVYISCDSATLARDVKILLSNYALEYVQPWDMFPNTAEVETVVHLVKTEKKGEKQ